MDDPRTVKGNDPYPAPGGIGGSTVETSFTCYRQKKLAELRPYTIGEDLAGVSISEVDRADRWLVAQRYFEDNFEVL